MPNLGTSSGNSYHLIKVAPRQASANAAPLTRTHTHARMHARTTTLHHPGLLPSLLPLMPARVHARMHAAPPARAHTHTHVHAHSHHHPVYWPLLPSLLSLTPVSISTHCPPHARTYYQGRAALLLLPGLLLRPGGDGAVDGVSLHRVPPVGLDVLRGVQVRVCTYVCVCVCANNESQCASTQPFMTSSGQRAVWAWRLVHPIRCWAPGSACKRCCPSGSRRAGALRLLPEKPPDNHLLAPTWPAGLTGCTR